MINLTAREKAAGHPARYADGTNQRSVMPAWAVPTPCKGRGKKKIRSPL